MGGDPMKRITNAFIANTTKIKDTPQKIVELYGVI